MVICEYSSVCQEGCSTIPPALAAETLDCPHKLRHLEFLACNTAPDACTWSRRVMRDINGGACICRQE